MNQENQFVGDEMHEDGGIPAADIVPRTYTFHGVQVKFPLEAYHSQQEMMNEILYHVIRGQNLLTESAAGTGKTLALLCSLLAYQEHHATLGNKRPLIFSWHIPSTSLGSFASPNMLTHQWRFYPVSKTLAITKNPMNIYVTILPNI
ncbi:unnamed protein product [Allacma fusca]|uniref:Helicase ATP-binding domain-containing protein n=1 Tax=Allacma fusca TaxID=39272 RepID=A0A8J2LBR6_9HEXA|nr:unnamed protein product [Allacma fusca]